MRCFCGLMVGLILGATITVSAEDQAIPHAQDKPPNEPRDAHTAAKMMTVPEGFVVEVVAHEPDIINPVAMTFDEKGRVWITESVEYPRKEPGPGKDRVKILEDTDGDGAMDKFSIFLDGLNIPSGVAVGHGGVWVANSPDILFIPDKDRDGKADGEPQVVVTGFGRTDTHELPNSLTWGPDGWLYGLNGVFNHSHVKYAKSNPNYEKAGGENQTGWPLTCAMYRIHPRTWEFQVFAEGTSNPWGIAFNEEGEAFISACVIDHLWHIVETGYYHRQGGPYPPHTWKIESIVDYKHQKAAYCGITWLDSDAYPEKYRRKLYMGNIHGNCINVDRVERNGATYKGFGEPDFLTANDAWFMPVVQKTGPDGCLWILDWYDRYHCYQDAGRDPGGIDRLKGRLYRVKYVGDKPSVGSAVRTAKRVPKFDLGAETDDQLIEKLGDPNVWIRETAQRVLQERDTPAIYQACLKQISILENSRRKRLHSTWTAAGLSGHINGNVADQSLRKYPREELFRRLLHDDDETLRAWGIRIFGDDNLARKSIFSVCSSWIAHKSPQVRLQAAIAVAKAGRSENQSTALLLAEVLKYSRKDKTVQQIVWQNLYPWLVTDTDRFFSDAEMGGFLDSDTFDEILPRIFEVIAARPVLVAKLMKSAIGRNSAQDSVRGVLRAITEKIQTGEISGEKLDGLRTAMNPVIQPLLQSDQDRALKWEASLLALSWKDPSAVDAARKIVQSGNETVDRRVAALNALISARTDGVLDVVENILSAQSSNSDLQSQILPVLSRLDDPRVAEIVLTDYAKFPAELQPKAIELLTQRAVWAKKLLAAIGEKKLKADVINVNQARRLRELKDDELAKLLKEHWGELRNGRNPDRDRVVAEMKSYIREHKGDEANGAKVFQKVCGQCHKIYGEGAEVGPDITRNGRNDYQQLLSNVFDPSLVIGAGFQSYTVLTHSGRVVNGLLVEESPQRVILKVQGGKQEIIPRDDVDEFQASELSLMPEQLEKQLTLPEIADLFAYITLDKPPTDPEAKRLAGVYDIIPRETTNSAEYAAIFQEVAPGFTTVSSAGVALLPEYHGKKGVVRTHPVSKDAAAIMRGKFSIPKDKKTVVHVEVSHEPGCDWRLLVGGRGERLLDEMIDEKSCPEGWAQFDVDLSKFAGQEIEVQVWNQANNWSGEFGYWTNIRVVSE